MHEPIARKILDDLSFMTLATADAEGRPWCSPVWFAQENYRELFWVSDPRARHSRNVAARAEVAIVVYDSTVVPGEGQAVYMSATAAQVTDPAEIERGIGVFSRASVREGMAAWGAERVRDDARLRLYRALVFEYSVLDKDAIGDVRVAVTL